MNAPLSLPKMCPNKESFLVRIFLFSDEKKPRIWTLFTQQDELIIFQPLQFYRKIILQKFLQNTASNCFVISNLFLVNQFLHLHHYKYRI